MFLKHKPFCVSSECSGSRLAGLQVPAYAVIVAWAFDTIPLIYVLPVEVMLCQSKLSNNRALPRSLPCPPTAPRSVQHGHVCAGLDCAVPARGGGPSSDRDLERRRQYAPHP